MLIKSSCKEHICFILSHKESSTGAIPNGSITSAGGTDNGAIMAVHCAAPSFENMFHHELSSSVPNSLSSVMRVESVGSQSGLTESVHSAGSLKFDIHGTPAFHPHSLPEYYDGLTNGTNCNSTGSVSSSINVRPPERIDNRHFTRVSSGHSIEFNEGGKCNESQKCTVFVLLQVDICFLILIFVFAIFLSFWIYR